MKQLISLWDVMNYRDGDETYPLQGVASAKIKLGANSRSCKSIRINRI